MRTQIRTSYASASLNRLEESRALLESGLYTGSIYFAGLAAESMLKAFIQGKGEEIKGHNIPRLAQDAHFSRRLSGGVRARVDSAITECSQLWRNLFRYGDALDFERWAKESGTKLEADGRLVRFSALGQDGLRIWSVRIYNLAALIVQEGQIVCQSKKR